MGTNYVKADLEALHDLWWELSTNGQLRIVGVEWAAHLCCLRSQISWIIKTFLREGRIRRLGSGPCSNLFQIADPELWRHGELASTAASTGPPPEPTPVSSQPLWG